MVLVTRSDRLENAWKRVHVRLARTMADTLPLQVRSILEVGAGRGQLTLPLLDRVASTLVTIVDQFKGPYTSDRSSLRTSVNRAGAQRRVRVVSMNALRFLLRSDPARFDAVLSSEFLPEVAPPEVGSFFRACRRVLRPGGVTVHAFLSPDPANARQRLVVEADSDPRWARSPPPAWFSPPPSWALRELRSAGFRRTRLLRFPGGLRMRGEAARSQLRRWGVTSSFARTFADQLRRPGLELPDWIVIYGTKPA
jgi:SAM-dependent methyltransferase